MSNNQYTRKNNPLKPIPLQERFEKFISMEPMSGCWLWTGACNSHGYGQIGIGTRQENRGFAHRVSYELYIGPIPADLHVCHHCDTPSCVNPYHLFLGTPSDNRQDCIRKGRFYTGNQQGGKNGNVKLTEEQVIQIRHDNRLQRHIAEDYGVSRGQISLIKHRKCWDSVT